MLGAQVFFLISNILIFVHNIAGHGMPPKPLKSTHCVRPHPDPHKPPGGYEEPFTVRKRTVTQDASTELYSRRQRHRWAKRLLAVDPVLAKEFMEGMFSDEKGVGAESTSATAAEGTSTLGDVTGAEGTAGKDGTTAAEGTGATEGISDTEGNLLI